MAFRLNLGTLGLGLVLDDKHFRAAMKASDRALSSFKKTAKRAAVGGALALGAGLAYSVKSFADFEQAAMDAAAVTSEGAAALGKFKAAALDASAGSMFSGKQAAKALGFLAKAGFEVDEAITALPGVLELATAGGTDLATTADIASDTLTAFSMSAAELSRVNDVMAATFTTSNTDLRMLGESMKYVAPVASSMGQSIETTAASLGILANSGIKASQGGTTLRMMMLRLVRPVRKSQEALDELGVKTRDAEGNMRDFVTILEDIAEAGDDLGNADMGRIMGDLFGTEAVAGAMKLVEAAGKAEDSLRDYREELEKSEGTSRRIASLMERTVTGSVKILKGNVENLAITFGQFFGPAIFNVATRLGELVKRTVKSDDGFENMRETAVATIRTMAGFVRALGGATRVAAYLVGGFGELVRVFNLLGNTIAYSMTAFMALDAMVRGDDEALSTYLGAFQEQEKQMRKLASQDFGSFFRDMSSLGDQAAKAMDGIADGLIDGADEAARMKRETFETLVALEKLERMEPPKRPKPPGGPTETPQGAAMGAARELLGFSASIAGNRQAEVGKKMAKEAAARQKAADSAILGLVNDHLDSTSERYKAQIKADEEMAREAERAAERQREAWERLGEEFAGTLFEGLQNLASGLFGEGAGDAIGALGEAARQAEAVYASTGSAVAAAGVGLASLVGSVVNAFVQTEAMQEGLGALASAFERTIGAVGPLEWLAERMDGAFGAVILAFEALAPVAEILGVAGFEELLGRAFFGAVKGFILALVNIGEFIAMMEHTMQSFLAGVLRIPQALLSGINAVLEALGLPLILMDGIDAAVAAADAAARNADEAAHAFAQARAELAGMTYEDAQGAYRREVERSTEAMRELNDELRNAPSGFKIRLDQMRYGADEGVPVSGDGGGSTTNVVIHADGMRVDELLVAMERREIIRRGSSQVTPVATTGSDYVLRRLS